MKKQDSSAHQLDSLSKVHRALGLAPPWHPLISLLDNSQRQIEMDRLPPYHVLHFYKISFITQLGGRLKYGQGYYDFEEGSLLFGAPNQLIGGDADHAAQSGYGLLIHPDFLQGHPLAKKIKGYGFFSYSIHEALHLSQPERQIILSIYQNIQQELNSRIDDFSDEVLIAQIELLLTYANRFYKRQFLTRRPVSHGLLPKLEELLESCFEEQQLLANGIPTVQYLAGQLHYSPNYLSDLLRSLTGQSAQQHIHYKLIEKAKEKLSTSQLSISEVAYQLGFEHPQSFTRLFKTKTKLSPAEFRQRFN